MIKELKISNIVFSGRMPFKKRLSEENVNALLLKSELKWQLINEECSPIIRRFVEKNNLTIHGKKGNSHISIWVSGATIITGVTSRKEAETHYLETIKDIKKLCKGVLK